MTPKFRNRGINLWLLCHFWDGAGGRRHCSVVIDNLAASALQRSAVALRAAGA